MAYTVLARKYRSGNFDELVGQEHIAKTLKRAIETGRIAHAYLFCGTRGTGKTSSARILAKALNCQAFDQPTPNPCGKCDSCLSIARGDDIDVIEIDAASNTGVDNVREIIENSQYRPARSRFKVYIIDEVHMLSKSAFNALLKTLEEPPSHVKFILATTEPEKVLPTILSRCQRYDFRNIPAREIAAHLKEICKKENITADDDAVALVAKVGNGSMRDALSLLDRLLSLGDKNLTATAVEEMLGLPRAQVTADLAGAIGSGDVKGTLSQTDAMLMSGMSADLLVGALSDHLRNLLIARTCGTGSGLLDVPGFSDAELAAQAGKFSAAALAQDIAILEELRRNMRQSQTGQAMLDATLVRLALSEQFTSIDQMLGQADAPPMPAAPIQKKKPEGMTVNPSPTLDGATAACAETRSPSSVASSQILESIAIGAPLVETADVASDSSDDDDDLPRPGKVWDGPSLKELLKEQTAAPTPKVFDDSIEAIGDGDVAKIWPQLLTLMERQASSLAGVLRMARFGGIEDDVAVIRFPAEGGTFARTWSSNGKKDQISRALSDLRGIPTGVRFDVAAEVEIVAEPSAPAAARPMVSPPAAVAPIIPTMPASAPLSIEAIAEAERDPLVQLVLKEFGGRIRNLE